MPWSNDKQYLVEYINLVIGNLTLVVVSYLNPYYNLCL